MSLLLSVGFIDVPTTSIIRTKNAKKTTHIISATMRHCTQSYISLPEASISGTSAACAFLFFLLMTISISIKIHYIIHQKAQSGNYFYPLPYIGANKPCIKILSDTRLCAISRSRPPMPHAAFQALSFLYAIRTSGISRIAAPSRAGSLVSRRRCRSAGE